MATVFRIGRGWVIMFRCSGLVLIAAGIVGLLIALLQTDHPAPRFMIFLGSVMLAVGARAVYIGFRSGAYSVELSQEGVRLPAKNSWIPWSAVRDLRERPLLQRVDLLDHSGARIASFEYQIEGFLEVLRQAVGALRLAPPEQDTFRGGLRTASITDDGVSVRGGLARAQFIPWSDITEVELGLSGPSRHMMLDVFVIDRSGVRKNIRPGRANPFHLAARIASRLERRRSRAEGG